MAKRCTQCGHENEDSAVRCVCGNDLPSETGAEPAPTMAEPAPPAAAPTAERRLLLRKILLLVWALGFVPLYAVLCSRLPMRPILRALIGTGVFCVPAVAAFWFLGRDKLRTLRIWRILFVVWGVLLLPLLLTAADGLAAEGWPRGRFNKQIEEILTCVLVFSVPGFLVSLPALVRTYRVASVLALATGLAYLVNTVFLFRVTAPAKGLRLLFADVLDIVLLGAQLGSYLSIPIGIALIVGGIMTFRAAQKVRPYPKG
jgi:hypothetical protein